VKKISQYFPANPQRLTSVLKLAILTQSYDDVEKYYQVFTKIDERSEEIIKYVCAALVICGKYYLQRKVPSRALELFNKAGITAQGRARILQDIIVTLIEFRMAKDAQEFLKRFPPEQQSLAPYLTLKLLIADGMGANPGVIIGEGRKMIADNLHDPLLYELLIRLAADSQMLTDYAQSLIEQAQKRWPEQKARFAKHGPKAAASASSQVSKS